MSKKRFWKEESDKLMWLNVMNMDEFIRCAIKGRKREWELGYGGEDVGER